MRQEKVCPQDKPPSDPYLPWSEGQPEKLCAFGKFLEESTELLTRIFGVVGKFLRETTKLHKNCQYEENFFDLKLSQASFTLADAQT